MAVRAIGNKRNNKPYAGNDSGSEKPEPGILDIGSVATGNESAIDSADNTTVSDDDGFIDPSSIADSSSDSDAPFGRFANGKPRKRRPNGQRGSGSGGSDGGKTNRKTASEISAFVGDILYSLHEIAAKVTKIEELELSNDESQMLGAAIIKVSEQYTETPLIDPKVIAWVGLAKCLGQVYIPRVTAAKLRKRDPIVVKAMPQRFDVN